MVLLGLGPLLAEASGSADDSVQASLRARLEHVSQDQPLLVAGESIHSPSALPAFYERRLFAPAWTTNSGLNGPGVELLSLVGRVAIDGLDPLDYHLVGLDRLLAREASESSVDLWADVDILLTDAFLTLAGHLVSGRVDPETFDSEWSAQRREVDIGQVLEKAVSAAAPEAALRGLHPSHSGYFLLRAALETYRGLVAAGGWEPIAEGPILRPGDNDPRIPALRARLRVTDRSVSLGATPELYDDDLIAAVVRFQLRHGLGSDGVVGEKTLAALNVAAEERVRQIELNLERWRWLPQDLGSRYVLVNIPDFRLVVVEEEKTVLEMRVAVGRRYRRTPVFSDTMRYLVVNPSWDVPRKLAVQDKLPEIQKDASYLERMGFLVVQGWGADQVLVDPASVDWSQITPSQFPYHLRQLPGPLNALGRIKFMFPNRFNVYLHDTPDRRVFLASERDVSSGCIRLEQPRALADLLLSGSPRWTTEVIDATLAGGKETTMTLERPVPVHLLYWTAWADAEGTVHFRRDLYGRDQALAEALRQGAEAARSRP